MILASSGEEGFFVKKSRKAAFEPKTFLAKMGDGKTITEYQKDQVVFSQGSEADAVFYIQRGKIKLTVVSERGKEAVVGVLEPRHFFGEGCLNGHPLRVTRATAIDQSLVTRITKGAMIQFQRENGWLGPFCFWRISAKKPRLSRSLESLVRKHSRR